MRETQKALKLERPQGLASGSDKLDLDLQQASKISPYCFWLWRLSEVPHYLRYKSSDCKKNYLLFLDQDFSLSQFMQPICTEFPSDVERNSCSCGETDFYFCDISFHGHIYHLMGQGRAISLKESRRKGVRSIFWAKSDFSSCWLDMKK